MLVKKDIVELDGSDLTIGKATNTGAIIGTEEGSNGKIRIDEYIGKNIGNSDTYNTTGATVGGERNRCYEKSSGNNFRLSI